MNGATAKKMREFLMSAQGSENVSVVEYHQKRPYSFIKVKCRIRNGVYEGVGFAKVRYPDRWNPAIGYDIAYRKAIADAVRKC